MSLTLEEPREGRAVPSCGCGCPRAERPIPCRVPLKPSALDLAHRGTVIADAAVNTAHLHGTRAWAAGSEGDQGENTRSGPGPVPEIAGPALQPRHADV